MKVEIIKCLKDNFSYLLINEKNKKTVVITLHDFEIAKKIGDYFIYLENGKILLQDSYENFFNKFNF